ncbi:MAG: HAD family hydrolase [Polyangiales bacterium]
MTADAITLQTPKVVLFDAGNTLVFLDHDALAAAGHDAGLSLTGAALRDAEPTAKKRYEAELTRGLSHEAGWDLYVTTIFTTAGATLDAARAATVIARRAHDDFNLWRKVPSDLLAALALGKQHGLRYGVVSNSEGRLPALFSRVGLDGWFEHVVDSALEGVRKPDPEIFRRALARMGVEARDALYAGDIPNVDVDGARGVGMQAVLVDTLGHFPDYTGAPRFASVAALMRALCG